MATVTLSTVGEALAFAASQSDARDAIGACAVGTGAGDALAGNTPRLSANAITAIAALTSGSSAADIVAALKTP